MAADRLPMSLTAGLAALTFALPPDAPARLAAYLALLEKWNRIYNLTAIRTHDEMVIRHLLDSLIVLPYLADCRRLVDVGSGAGLPAIPLAIAHPALQVTSVESKEKKAAFQRQAKLELGLDNLDVRCMRSEMMIDRFDTAISRAFASLADFVRLAGHLAPRLLAMKGKPPVEEKAPDGWRLAATHELTVPGLNAARTLVVLEREE